MAGRSWRAPAGAVFLSPRMNSAVIALDVAGNIYAAGNTNTLDFPTTPGAFMEKGYGPYVRKFDPAGNVLWSTYLSDKRIGTGYPVYPADMITAVAVDPTAVLTSAGGSSPSAPFPTGPYTPTPYVIKMNPSGTVPVYSKTIGHEHTWPASIVVDSAGNAIVSGPGNTFPTSPVDYITTVNPAGSALVSDTTYANGSRGAALAIDPSGRLHAAGSAALVPLIDRSTPSPSGVSGVANAAGPSLSGRIVPGGGDLHLWMEPRGSGLSR